LLPAVQSAREAARRISCGNNLRQIGIGLQSYHAAMKCFPVGGIEYRPMVNPKTRKPYGASGRQLAWSAFLLPYLDQTPLHQQINFSKAFDAAENAVAAAYILSVYICPSVPQGNELRNGRGPCHYGGIYGECMKVNGTVITSPNNPPKGAMLYNQAISAADIRDGTSNTLIVAEDSDWPEGQWINGANLFEQMYPIHGVPEGQVDNEICSKHPGGANGLFADSSTRFLPETLDPHVLAAICTRAGYEPLGEF
jgi:prepilin-type processing-associated H-X9-DG protein